jgi:four helix bundle protein
MKSVNGRFAHSRFGLAKTATCAAFGMAENAIARAPPWPCRSKPERSANGTPFAQWLAMSDWVDQLEARTQTFAVEVVRLCVVMEGMPGCREIARQLTRSAGSVAANHRAMRRGRSSKEFKAKLQIVDEEADECVCWLEMAARIETKPSDEVGRLLREARELRAIFAKAKATARRQGSR